MLFPLKLCESGLKRIAISAASFPTVRIIAQPTGPFAASAKRVNHCHSGWLEVPFVVRRDSVPMIKRRGCDERILASHGAILRFQFREQLFPPHQHWLGQLLRGGRELPTRLVQPGHQTWPVRIRRLIESVLKFGERNDADEKRSVVFLQPGREPGRHPLSFQEREQVRIEQDAHLKGNSCRSGAGIG